MSDLTDRIAAAQREAGERVVMDDLRQKGLLGVVQDSISSKLVTGADVRASVEWLASHARFHAAGDFTEWCHHSLVLLAAADRLECARETDGDVFSRFPVGTLFQKHESGTIVALTPDGGNTAIQPETSCQPSDKQVAEALAQRCDWLCGRLDLFAEALTNLHDAGSQIQVSDEKIGAAANDPPGWRTIIGVEARVKDLTEFNRRMAQARAVINSPPSQVKTVVPQDGNYGS